MKMRTQKVHIFGGDLETDNDGSKAWVVQWAVSDGATESTGTTIEGFKAELLRRMRSYPSIIYFHNLKYDLTFIKYALYDLMISDAIAVLPIMKKGNPVLVRLVPPENSGMHELILRDSLKKLQGSLSSIAKMVGMEKLDGYDFVPGWSEAVDFNDPKNWDYVKMDARIVAVAMQELHKDGNTKSTFSGDAWSNAQKVLSGDRGYANKEYWATLFPKLGAEIDAALRPGYTGGLNISRYHGYNEGQITHADVNSMYPSVMYYDELPHGNPIYSRERPNASLFVVKARFKLKLKPGMIPWFIFKQGGEYLLEDLKVGTPVEETKYFHTMTLTNIDVQLLSEWYDMEIDDSDAEYWAFKSNVGIFRTYIDKYMSMKKSAKKGTLLYQWSKLMMNSLYGRFGLNPNGEDTDLIFDYEINDVKWSATPKVDDIDGYLPYAMFITAHARRRLLDYVKKCGPLKVIHCDTDSVIHFGGRVPGIEYGRDLGTWDIESEPVAIYEGGFKRYVEVLDPAAASLDALHIAAAGVARRRTDGGLPLGMWVEIWDDPSVICTDKTLGNPEYRIKSDWLRSLYIEAGIDPDKVNTMKLIPVKCPGGCILTERKHKLNDCMNMLRRR